MRMSENTFPGPEGFVVDPSAKVEGQNELTGVVCVVGKAQFESVKTGKKWKEQFIYRLSEFDKEGRIGHWVFSALLLWAHIVQTANIRIQEIWADPLSAFEAVGSEEGHPKRADGVKLQNIPGSAK
jgi:hypothetical protein